MIRGPFLVCLDHSTGTAHRYVRVFDQSGAGLRWQTTIKSKTTYDPQIGLSPDVVDLFRVTGNV